MRYTKGIMASIVMSVVAVSAAPAMGAGGSASSGQSIDRPGAVGNTELPADIRAALERDLGLSPEQAKKHGELQDEAIKLDKRLRVSLGKAYAGSRYDASSGKLVAMVSDAGKLDEAERAGADARMAKHSKAELDSIKAELDESAGKAKDASASNRKPNGPRKASADGMVSWYVDTESNTVRVTVEKTRANQAKAALAKYGDAVTVVETDLAPRPTDRFMDGGDAINSSSCSAGLNLRNPSTGKGYLLTAGHCVSAGSTLNGHDTTWWGAPIAFGPVLESWFPGVDDALARNDTGHYIQGPWVDTNPTHGGVITTSSYTDAPVGTTLCKSGITTRWTCGQITAKDETVTYSGNRTVYGMTRHSACVEPGDSGGANVSVTSSYRAEGVTSGASMIWDGSRYRCRSTFGQQNVSWYYPIADSLAYYGPKYGITTW
jgi:streptogrisin C